MLVSLGAQMAAIAEAKGGWKEPGVSSAAPGAALRQIADQSFVRGVSSLIESIRSPGRRGAAYVETMAGSVVPAVVGRMAAGMDPHKRQPEGPVQAFAARIPGVRERAVPAKVSALTGELMKEPRGVVSFIFDALSTTPGSKDPLLAEMRRLGINVRLPDTSVPDSARFKGERPRTEAERRSWFVDAAPKIKAALDNLTARSEYVALPDEMKKDLFDRVGDRLAREAYAREQGKGDDRTPPEVVVQDAIENLAAQWSEGENRKEAQALLKAVRTDPTAAARAPRAVQERAVGLIKSEARARIVSELIGALERKDSSAVRRSVLEAQRLGIELDDALKAKIRRRLAVERMLDAQAQLTP
jgi:hypothetical protein